MCGAEVRDNTQVPFVCAIVGSVVATIFVLLRLFVVFTPGGKKPDWDDALLVACLVSISYISLELTSNILQACALVPGFMSRPCKYAMSPESLWI